mmetsp:Transcript_11258/g.23836  ORF Transcript_11258/g.23836 Transcript_11258/m.23836 type:complete len:202 (-) Transcript_11258:283-888(-)
MYRKDLFVPLPTRPRDSESSPFPFEYESKPRQCLLPFPRFPAGGDFCRRGLKGCRTHPNVTTTILRICVANQYPLVVVFVVPRCFHHHRYRHRHHLPSSTAKHPSRFESTCALLALVALPTKSETRFPSTTLGFSESLAQAAFFSRLARFRFGEPVPFPGALVLPDAPGGGFPVLVSFPVPAPVFVLAGVDSVPCATIAPR